MVTPFADPTAQGNFLAGVLFSKLTTVVTAFKTHVVLHLCLFHIGYNLGSFDFFLAAVNHVTDRHGTAAAFFFPEDEAKRAPVRSACFIWAFMLRPIWFMSQE